MLKTVDIVKRNTEALKWGNVECIETYLRILEKHIPEFKPDMLKAKKVFSGFWSAGYHGPIATLQMPPNFIFDGELFEGNAHGQGVLSSSDGVIIFVGLFFKGSFNDGRMYLPNGTIYEGKWFNEGLNGNCQIVDAFGNPSMGLFCCGDPINFTGFYYFNDNTYEGDWKNGISLESRVLFPGAIEYHGNLYHLIPHGLGSFKYGGGWTCEGEFRHGEIYNLEGKFKNVLNQAVYEGKWVKGHGKGTAVFANGDRYVGSFISLNFHGEGEYFLVSKNVKGFFLGVFSEGTIVSGKGSIRDVLELGPGPETVITGTWAAGKGKASISYPDGTSYEGEVDGRCLPHGMGNMNL